MSPPRIIAIAAHPLVRKGIEAIVAQEFPGASLEFLHGLPDDLVEAELIVYDAEIGNAMDSCFLERMRITSSLKSVLVFNMAAEAGAESRCILSTSLALLSKDADVYEFIAAMQALIIGQPPLPGQTIGMDVFTAKLSRRELEIFSILAQEIPVRIIARRLGISVKTVEAHRESIKNKLGFHSASEVVSAASSWLSSL